MKLQGKYEKVKDTDKIFVKETKISLDFGDYKTLGYIFTFLSILILFIITILIIALGMGMIIQLLM